MPSVERIELKVHSRKPRRAAARRGAGRGGRRPDRSGQDARTRILETAYRLFSMHGINAVGIDRIIAEAHVAKATLYHHFPSKQDLVRSFLELRETRWTVGWLQAEVERLAQAGQNPALAVFDVLDGWLGDPAYESCAFVGTLLEIDDPESPIHQLAERHLEVVRALLEGWAARAGARRPVEVSYQLQLLMMGAIVSASRGDRRAAVRARPLAERLLQRGGGARTTRVRGTARPARSAPA